MLFLTTRKMRFEVIRKRNFILFLICAALALFSSNAKAAEEENPLAKFSKILPNEIGGFRKLRKDEITDGKAQSTEGIISSFNRYYEYKKGFGAFIDIKTANSEDEAYSFFSIEL